MKKIKLLFLLLLMIVLNACGSSSSSSGDDLPDGWTGSDTGKKVIYAPSSIGEGIIDGDFRVVVENYLYQTMLKSYESVNTEYVNNRLARVKDISGDAFNRLINLKNSDMVRFDKVRDYLLTAKDNNEKRVLVELVNSIDNSNTIDQFLLSNVNIDKNEVSYKFYDLYYNEFERKIMPNTGAPFAIHDSEISGEGQKHKVVYLTYDDGVHPVTPYLLKVLKDNNVKATFFIQTRSLNPQSKDFNTNLMTIKNMYSEGHELGSHTVNHPALSTISNGEISSELTDSKKTIYDITGYMPRYFRTPYGDRDLRVIGAINSHYIANVIWNIDSQDFRKEFTEDISVERIIRLVHLNNGGILLAHDPYIKTLNTTRRIIPRLKKAGFSFDKIANISNLK